jgi:hypothetical protein
MMWGGLAQIVYSLGVGDEWKRKTRKNPRWNNKRYV